MSLTASMPWQPHFTFRISISFRILALALLIGASGSWGIEVARAQCPAVFDPPTTFQAGTFYSGSIAVGDFNGDGKLDIAKTSGDNDGSVSILFGTGTGSFGPATTFLVGSIARGVAVGDFNGDGKPDLAVVNFYSNSISILLGTGLTGAAAFGPPTNFPVSPLSYPSQIAVGDFNGDGKLDIVVSLSVFHSVSVLLGTGTGTFGPATNFLAGPTPAGMAVADLNGDGKLDIVVANSGANTISVLLGTGTGAFGSPTNYTVGTNPGSVAVADFNGDGKLDIVASNFGSGVSPSNVSVLLGTGTGTFGTVTNFTVSISPGQVVVGDFNGDGKTDLVVTYGGSGSDSISVLLGTGTGSFGAPSDLTVGSAQSSVAVADFNGDGKPDLAVVNSPGNIVSVLLGASNIPAIATQPSNQSVLSGSSVSFTVAATSPGGIAPTYQWRRNGVNLADGGTISGATAATLTINPAIPSDGASYDCVATNTCGSTPSSPAQLTVDFIAGACCNTTNGHCTQETSASCTSLGLAYVGDGTACSVATCSAAGACCHGATCATASGAAACANGGTYLGDGTACSPIGRNGPINACCPADYDHSGGLSMADVFSYLQHWFAGCP